jgi:hypothetical protein
MGNGYKIFVGNLKGKSLYEDLIMDLKKKSVMM